MNTIQINTTQNVNIDFELASFGERLLASLIDFVAILGYFFISFAILDQLGLDGYHLDQWSNIAIRGVVSLPAALYTLCAELFFHGQTLGKKIMKIKVVKVDGYSASFIDFFIRWIMRIVDIWLNFSIVGIICIIVSKNGQRIGGLASGTAVISVKNKYQISATILENIEANYIPTFPTVINLSDRDMQIVKDLYLTARKSKDIQLLDKLRRKVEAVTNTSKGNLSDMMYLYTIMQDYTHFTQDM